MIIIPNSLRKFSLSLYSQYCINHFSTGSISITDNVYQKLRVTRLPHQKSTVFLETSDTVSTLLNHIRQQFDIPNTTTNESNQINRLVGLNRFQMKVGQTLTEEEIAESQRVQELPAIELLISGDFIIYENNPQNNQCQLCYGIEIVEFNSTNNRNLPQKIAQNIIQLSEQWPVAPSVPNTQNIPPPTPTKISKILQQRQTKYQPEVLEELKNERQSQIQEARHIMKNYLQIFNFYRQKEIYDSQHTRRLVVNLLFTMGINWSFLFAVTYGGYGWDVGEPLSYLSGLGVDLLAMMGLFQVENQLRIAGRKDFEKIAAIVNAEAHLKMKQMQITHYKRII